MEWQVIFDPDFEVWFYEQEQGFQDEAVAELVVLQEQGPRLGRPRVDTLNGSAFSNMKALRVQYKGDPWRLLFAFDPEREAIALVGGNKTGQKRWYQENIPIADQRFRAHLQRLKKQED